MSKLHDSLSQTERQSLCSSLSTCIIHMAPQYHHHFCLFLHKYVVCTFFNGSQARVFFLSLIWNRQSIYYKRKSQNSIFIHQNQTWWWAPYQSDGKRQTNLDDAEYRNVWAALLGRDAKGYCMCVLTNVNVESHKILLSTKKWDERKARVDRYSLFVCWMPKEMQVT